MTKRLGEEVRKVKRKEEERVEIEIREFKEAV